MWFKNLLVYRLTQELSLTFEAFDAALRSKPAQKPASQVVQTAGFISPISKDPDAPLAHQVEGVYLIALRTYERRLPDAVVKDELQEKVDEIETSQCRRVFKKEKDQLKDEVVQALLPRAFVHKKTTLAALDLKNNLVLVNTANAKAAEAVLSTLREVLGSLPVRPVTVKISPSATFTEWVKSSQLPENFYLLSDCCLNDTHEDGGEIKVKRQDLTTDDIKQLLDSGKVVTRIQLAYKDQLSFTLNEKLGLQGLRFESLLQDQAVENGGDDKDGQFDATFLLMTATFNELLPQLFTALGGEDLPAGI